MHEAWQSSGTEMQELLKVESEGLRRKKGKGWLLILEACRQVHTDAHIVDCPKGLNGITEHAHSTLSPEAESEEELEPLDEDERGKWKGWLKTQQSKN